MTRADGFRLATAALALTLAGLASAHAVEQPTLSLSSDLRVAVLDGREVELHVKASSGDYAAVAARVSSGAGLSRWLRRYNENRPSAEPEWIRVPLQLLSEEYRALVLTRLFPQDERDGADWVHRARTSRLPTYGEGLWQVAEWFTGRGDNFRRLMQVNRLASPDLVAGQRIRIPAALLHPALAPRQRSDDGLLEFDTDDDGPYGMYRLRAGEALYSAVIVRFTGRTSDEDVREIAEILRARSGIPDLRDIPAGYPIKIPLDLIEPEFLPHGHPRRLQAEATQDELSRELARQPVASDRRGLAGVLVVLDAGHGGKDLGTINNGIWEHDYVYDVACRLRQKLEQRTEADVRMTIEDAETGCEPSVTDKLRANRQGTILTNPPFLAEANGDARVGVNLRWYLANSIYRKAVADGIDPDRVVFLSLHADSRHPSLRGVMVYVPGADYRTKTYGYYSRPYERFEEVREKPTIRFSRKQRVRSEAISRELAGSIVSGFHAQKLPVQPYQPVRHRIIRGKQRYAPAVLRANQVPTKVLVEMLNLSNRDDAALLAAARDRDRLSEAILSALLEHFGEESP